MQPMQPTFLYFRVRRQLLKKYKDPRAYTYSHGWAPALTVTGLSWSFFRPSPRPTCTYRCMAGFSFFVPKRFTPSTDVGGNEGVLFEKFCPLSKLKLISPLLLQSAFFFTT